MQCWRVCFNLRHLNSVPKVLSAQAFWIAGKHQLSFVFIFFLIISDLNVFGITVRFSFRYKVITVLWMRHGTILEQRWQAVRLGIRPFLVMSLATKQTELEATMFSSPVINSLFTATFGNLTDIWGQLFTFYAWEKTLLSQPTCFTGPVGSLTLIFYVWKRFDKMSIAVATPRHCFGLKADVADNICYLDEQTIIYPSGSNCILFNIDQKSQRFIPGTDKSSGITAMAVSPNRRYVAIAEKGEKATITIYDLNTLRKKKVLSSPEVQSNEFVSLAFSPDSKYLVSQGGRPDWTLLYWTWEKAKVMAVTKSTNQMNSPVYQVQGLFFRLQQNKDLSK